MFVWLFARPHNGSRVFSFLALFWSQVSSMFRYLVSQLRRQPHCSNLFVASHIISKFVRFVLKGVLAASVVFATCWTPVAEIACPEEALFPLCHVVESHRQKLESLSLALHSLSGRRSFICRSVLRVQGKLPKVP